MKKNIAFPKKIIIRLPNWLGDLVMATPVVRGVKTALRDVHLTVVCLKAFEELLSCDPHIDEILTLDKNIIKNLKTGNFDLGILLTNSFSSAYHFFRGGVKRRIGFAKDWRSFLLTDPVPYAKELHQEARYKKLLAPLGITASCDPKIYADKLPALDGESRKMRVGISFGAAFGPAKCWPLSRYLNVAKALLKNGDVAVFFFDSSPSPVVQNFCLENEGAVNLTGKTSLKLFASYLKSMDLLLTNDSGPMHLSSALDTDLVAIFGSTSPLLTGPRFGEVIKKEIACSPCFKRECPSLKCLLDISEEEVLEKIKARLTCLKN